MNEKQEINKIINTVFEYNRESSFPGVESLEHRQNMAETAGFSSVGEMEREMRKNIKKLLKNGKSSDELIKEFTQMVDKGTMEQRSEERSLKQQEINETAANLASAMIKKYKKEISEEDIKELEADIREQIVQSMKEGVPLEFSTNFFLESLEKVDSTSFSKGVYGEELEEILAKSTEAEKILNIIFGFIKQKAVDPNISDEECREYFASDTGFQSVWEMEISMKNNINNRLKNGQTAQSIIDGFVKILNK